MASCCRTTQHLHGICAARSWVMPSVRGMRVTMILPALTEATGPLFRPIKYSLFPPLGLATLAGYLDPDDEVRIFDEHVERLRLTEDRPDLVVIQAYTTRPRRS